MNKKIGIIGCGNMGEAIVKRLALRSKTAAQSIIVTDIDTGKINRIRNWYKIDTTDDMAALIKQSHTVILAVKPKDFDVLLRTIRPFLRNNKVVISIAAGVSTAYIEKKLGAKIPVIRVMPNMAAAIGEAISSISAGKFARPKDMKAAREVFSAIGDVVDVDEKLVDSVTAISGSGPAYFFYFIEGLIEIAGELGLDKKTAKHLVLKTALGSAKLLEDLVSEPHDLRAKVTSKGGTTEAALAVFESEKFKSIIKKAVTRARDRSRELSKAR